jgi:hypothetical protein
MHWHPKTGEMKIFADDEKEPSGWLDTHPDQLALREATGAVKTTKPSAPAGDPDALTRPEVMAALKTGQIEFKMNESTVALTGKLTDALVAVLQEQGAEPDAIAAMSVRDMLAVVGAA